VRHDGGREPFQVSRFGTLERLRELSRVRVT
jgi:hypothetical protein